MSCSNRTKSTTVECCKASINVESESPRIRRRFFHLKYLFDRVAGWVLLVAFSPLTLLLWMIVKLTSPGPGFYKQERVGLNGETFDIFKLRSMNVDAEKSGKAIWAKKGDPRTTPVGRTLRKLHLDEIPQLFNVARGEMSFVGPRPERPSICETLAEEIDGYYDRTHVKPGITGLSQINLPPDEKIEDVRRKQVLDLCYIGETNVWLELRILIATALRIVGVKGETVMRWMRLCRRDLLVQQGLAQAHPTPHANRKKLPNVPRPSRAAKQVPVAVGVLNEDSPAELNTDSFAPPHHPR
ncbi:sugar transferase [Novipirellula artificiosorum]|uniref:UDP-glucose:undecaprenyl-phosphate glucose-1-phosphate transferase n=1 Tax=Novipirellula artificiosorum TaxID=2528016 RepID=A0A5C6CX35_9BACT|nr:sugar transferase [Novipirellula artificiosorum]TWU29132.1 UDP-glucose:undecaprenyl-phosphate glucose-1-phosphate transferase [Novipirellula artificiosorum]